MFKPSEICVCVYIQVNLSLNSGLTRDTSSLSSFPSPLSKVMFMKHISPPAPLIADGVGWYTSKKIMSSPDKIKICWDCGCLFLQNVKLCIQLSPSELSSYEQLSSGAAVANFEHILQIQQRRIPIKNMVLFFLLPDDCLSTIPVKFCFAQKCGPLSAKCFTMFICELRKI